MHPNFCNSHLKSQVSMQANLAVVYQSFFFFQNCIPSVILTLNRIQYAVYIVKNLSILCSFDSTHLHLLVVLTIWQHTSLIIIAVTHTTFCQNVWQTFKQGHDDEPSMVIHSFQYSPRGQSSTTPNIRFTN